MPQFTNQQVLDGFKNNDSYIIKKVENEITKLLSKETNQLPQEDTEDLIQDSLMVFFENILNPTFTLSCQYTTFIYQIAYNKLLQKWGKQKKSPIKHIYAQIDEENDQTTENEQIPDTYNFEEILWQAEIKELLFSVLQQLTELCKQLIFLRYDQTLSHKEIQIALNFNTESASKENLSRCQKSIKQYLLQHPNYTHLIANYFPFVLKFII
jgi:RNA polymerase sigma factor (sigma-70 family)